MQLGIISDWCTILLSAPFVGGIYHLLLLSSSELSFIDVSNRDTCLSVFYAHLKIDFLKTDGCNKIFSLRRVI